FELVVDPADRGVHGAVVKPIAHAQGEEVFAAAYGLGVDAEVFESDLGEAFELDGEEAELVERMIFERIRGDLRVAEIGLGEGLVIDDENAVGLEISDIGLKRRGIHGDQYVNSVARRVNIG